MDGTVMTMKRVLVTLGIAVALCALSLYGLAARAKNLMHVRKLQGQITAVENALAENRLRLQKMETNDADICNDAMGCTASIETDGQRVAEEDADGNLLPCIPPKSYIGIGCAFTFYHNGAPQLGTARHVFMVPGCIIEHAYVIFPGKRPIEVEPVGYSKRTDLARLKFKNPAEAFYGKPAKLGDAGKLRRGDPVICIGSPFGIPFYATFGKISLPLCAFTALSQPEVFSHTAQINHGNSGGPVISAKDGSLLGMTQMALKNSGLGLAIPARDIELIWDRLEKPGEMEAATLGVSFADTRSIIMAYLRKFPMPMPKEEGVVITKVQDGGPSMGKLQRGDLILQCGGKPMTTPAELAREILYVLVPGSKVTVAGIRDEKPFTVEIKATAE